MIILVWIVKLQKKKRKIYWMWTPMGKETIRFVKIFMCQRIYTTIIKIIGVGNFSKTSMKKLENDRLRWNKLTIPI